MSDNLRHPRRWFRFSLRTMFLAVTALCCWLGWETSVVRERRAFRERFRHVAGMTFSTADEAPQRIYSGPMYFNGLSLISRAESVATIPLIRRWLGDEAIQSIIYIPDMQTTSDEELARARRIFPEAQLIREYPEILVDP